MRLTRIALNFMGHRSVSVILITLVLSGAAVSANDYKIVDLQPEQNVDVYEAFNLSGRVFLRIVSKSGAGCADFWWINRIFGSVKQVGRHCGAVAIDIPGLSDFSIWSKLRAGGATEPTKIVGSSRETVANTVPVQW
jgi:hypothetical protein